MSEPKREDDKILKDIVVPALHKISEWQMETSSRLATGSERMDQMVKDISKLDRKFEQLNESLNLHLERETRLSERVSHIEGNVISLRSDVEVLKESRSRHKGMAQQKISDKTNWGLLASIGTMLVAFVALAKSFAGK